MKRRIIIDGYNLIYQIPELRRQLERDLEGARERLLDSLSLFSVKKQAEYTVVFDGNGQDQPESKNRRGLKVVFSKPPQKADPLIKRMLSEKKHNEDMIVVTSDLDICNYARICGVKVETSQKFALDMIAKPDTEIEKKFNHNLSHTEVDEWMELFNRGKRKDPN